ncbi:MAG: carbohydrate-binding family 9-like protein [Lacibacter sp.]
MQKLHIPYCAISIQPATAKQQLLEANDFALEQQPWPLYKSDAKVRFSIAHNGENIFILYRVKEKHVRYAATEINGSVWEDSCVEFFIAFDDDVYYNCEFNCIGTALIGYGAGRAGRELLPADVVRTVKCDATMQSENEYYVWELLLQIPVKIFLKHPVTSLSNTPAKVNFYKCGDLLPEPHFICWSKIESAEPDFHRPGFFSPALFEKSNATTSLQQ